METPHYETGGGHIDIRNSRYIQVLPSSEFDNGGRASLPPDDDGVRWESRSDLSFGHRCTY